MTPEQRAEKIPYLTTLTNGMREEAMAAIAAQIREAVDEAVAQSQRRKRL